MLIFQQRSVALPVSSGTGVVTTSIVGGVINVDAGLGGSARLYVRWSRPTTNTDTSTLKDLRSFKLLVGTTPGGSDVISGLDFFSTSQIGPLECRLTGLNSGVTYYVRVRAGDSAGNWSSDSGELSAVASIYNTPTRSWVDISSAQIIPASGDYRLTAPISGLITINANNVYLYGNGFTITHNSGNGIQVNAGKTGYWIDAINFSRTAGTGQHVFFNGTPGTGGQISNCTGMTVRDNAECISGTSDPQNLNGCRIYGNSVTIAPQTVFSEYQAFVSACTNFLAYGNTGVVSGPQRCCMYGNCGAFDAWSDTWSCTGSTLNAHYISTYGYPNFYAHDSAFTIGGTANTLRVFNLDGPGTTGTAGALTHQLLGHRFSYAVGVSVPEGPCIRNRDPNGPHSIGYCTFDMLHAPSNQSFSFGDSESGGLAGACPFGIYIYGITHLNYGSGQPFGMYGGAGWNNTAYIWDSDIGGISDSSSSSLPGSVQGNLVVNNCTIPNGVAAAVRGSIGSSTWDKSSTTVGGTDPFTNHDSWFGFNPANDIPSAPGTPALVTGVP